MKYSSKNHGGVYAEFLRRQTPFSSENREKSPCSTTNFLYTRKMSSEAPQFKISGVWGHIFLYRYFWHTNLQFFAWISWKIGSVHKFFLHRPRAVHSPTSGLYVGGSHSCETAIQWIDVKAAHSANLWILKIYWKKVVDFWKKVLTAIWVCGKLIWLSEIIDSETQKTKESFRKLKITLDNILNTW